MLADNAPHIQGFNKRISTMALASAGLGQNQGEMLADYDFVTMYGYLISSLPPDGAQREAWYAQVYHIDFDCQRLIDLWRDHGIIVCTISLPLSPQGAWLQVTTDLQRDFQGSLLLIPGGNVLVMPGSLLHAGGFRTDVRGHHRIHGHVFICPKGTALPDIGQLQNHYFGIGPGQPPVVRVHPQDLANGMQRHATTKVMYLQDNFGV
jgi:hypothetical protein